MTTSYKIGLKIRAARIAQKISQAELAAVIGTTTLKVIRLEEGSHVNPDPLLLRRISEYFGYPYDHFVIEGNMDITSSLVSRLLERFSMLDETQKIRAVKAVGDLGLSR